MEFLTLLHLRITGCLVYTLHIGEIGEHQLPQFHLIYTATSSLLPPEFLIRSTCENQETETISEQSTLRSHTSPKTKGKGQSVTAQDKSNVGDAHPAGKGHFHGRIGDQGMAVALSDLPVPFLVKCHSSAANANAMSVTGASEWGQTQAEDCN